MKKLLFPLFFTLTVSFSFAQDISGPKPILYDIDEGEKLDADNPDIILVGCANPVKTIRANYVDYLGSPDHYSVEQVPFHEANYLSYGGVVYTPAQLNIPGQMLQDINEDGVINFLDDDRWSHVQQLASNGSNLEVCYFGEPKTEFVISSNVILSFDLSYANGYSDWNLELPMGKIEPDANCGDGASGNNDAILLTHDTDPNDSDADFDSYSFWYIAGAEHERYFTMGTHHMPMYSCGADYGYATHQMVFYETTNIIEFNIRDKPLCDTWPQNESGLQAFGLQNNGSTQGIAVPDLDNHTQYQILNPDDPYSMSHVNPAAAAPVHDSVSYRFVPDGVNGVTPVFAWYKNWSGDPNTSDFVTNNVDLTVLDTDLPFDSNGDPIPVTYTAVVTYVEYCSGVTYHSTNNVTFEAIPVRMHIVENNAPDPNVETIDVEQITFCEGEGYTLQANVSSNDTYTIEWTEEPSGGSVQIVGDSLTYSIPTTTSPGIYRYTCTLTSNSCTPFSDEVVVTIISEANMNYPAPKAYCIDENNPIPENVSPTAPNTATQDEIELYYFTITIGGTTINHTDPDPTLDLNKDIWEDSLDMVPVANQDDPANPDWSEHSLSGKVNMSFAYQYAKDNNLLNAANEAEVTITYHAYCEQNSITDTIILRDAPLVLNPSGDPTATPVIEPIPEITKCETDAVNHTADFDITSINTYIANGIDLADLNIVWESQAGVALPSTGTYNTATIAVKVTVTLASDTTASCPKEFLFDLKVIPKPDIETPSDNLKQCENDTDTDVNIHTAGFLGTVLENNILDGQDRALYTVHYSAVNTNGDPVTQIEVNGNLQDFEYPLPAVFNIESVTVTAYVTLNDDTLEGCPSDEITFDLVVKETPLISNPVDVTTPETILTLCETDATNHTASFDTTNWDEAILITNYDNSVNPPTIDPNYYVEYDYIDENGVAVIGANTMPNPFVSSTQTITARAINAPNGTDSCHSDDITFKIEVIQTNITELQDTTTTPLTLCENDTNTDPNIHTAIFDTANWDETILIDNYDNTVNPPTIDPNYFVEYTYVDTDGNTIVTDDVNTIPANIELSSQTIKTIVKYKIDNNTVCESEEKTFDVTVINTPIVAALPTQDLILCETDPTNHTAEFDTSSWENTILGTYQLPTDYYITYTAFEVAADGTETPYTLPTPFPEATNSSTLPSLKIKVEVNADITTVDVNNNPIITTCSSTISEFYIKAIENPIVTPPVNTVNDPAQPTDIALILCETDTTNHTAEFDTTNWNSKILENYYDNSVTPPTIDSNYFIEYRAVTVDPVTSVETPYTLPNPFPEATNSSTLPSLKIYIKAYYKIDNNTKCYGNEEFFFIESNPRPKIKVPTDPNFPEGSETLEMCESDTDPDPNIHTAIFDTTNWLNIILDGQTGNNYHVVLTAKDLNGVDVTLPDPLPTNFETEFLIITAIVKDDNIPCDSVSKEFKLDVRVVPENNEIEDMTQCEDDNNTDPNVHTSTFDTTDWTSTVLGSQDPTNLVVEYTYELENGTQVTVEDPDDATNNIDGLPNEIISSSQTVHVVVRNVNSTIDPHTSCDSAEKTFDLVVINTPTYVIQNDITQCEDDTNTDPNIHESGFDTTGWDTAIKGITQTDSHYSVVYSAFTIDPITNNEIPYTLPDPLPAILNVPSITIRYQVIYTIDNNTYCESIPPNINPNQNTFDLNVRLIPFIAQLEDDMDTTGLIDLEICDDDNDPNIFTAQFDTTNWNKAILKDNYDNTVNPPTINPDFIIEYTYEDINGDSQTVNSTNLPNPLPLYSQTIKYTVKNITTGEATCPSEEKEFEVIVDLLPVGTNGKAVVCSGSQNYITIDNGSVTPPTYKDFTFDDFATFTDVDNNGNRNTYKWKAINDNPNITGESLSYVDNGDNTNPTITDVLINTTSNVQFVNYEVIPISELGCEGEPFNIEVQVDVVPVIINQTESSCNEEQFSLNLDNYTTLIGNTYKWHAIDNPNVTGETTDDTTTSTIEDTIVNTTGTLQTVEYMVTPTSAGGCEGDEFLVAVDVNPRPEFDLKPQYLICPDVHEVTIGEDSNPDDYTYHWYEADDMNVIIGYDKTLLVTEADLTASSGTYVLTVIDSLGCTYSQFTSVSMAEQVVITEIHVSDFNRPNNTIQIDVTGGSGQFEYTLNYIDYAGSSQSITQSSPIFENVVGGSYQIEVTDLTGCSVVTTSQDIYVLDYPPFFTPNGDLQHDTWQITGAQFIPNSKIYIFDRFGKVLAQVDPNSVIGWDGTYNGEQVPASDYWFTCEYIDPNTGNQKSAKGHFSIVRK